MLKKIPSDLPNLLFNSHLPFLSYTNWYNKYIFCCFSAVLYLSSGNWRTNKHTNEQENPLSQLFKVVPHMRLHFHYYYKHNLWWRIRKYTWYFWLSRNEKEKMINNVYHKQIFQHFRFFFNKYYCSCQYSTGKFNNTRSLIHFYIEIHFGKKIMQPFLSH